MTVSSLSFIEKMFREAGIEGVGWIVMFVQFQSPPVIYTQSLSESEFLLNIQYLTQLVFHFLSMSFVLFLLRSFIKIEPVEILLKVFCLLSDCYCQHEFCSFS